MAKINMMTKNKDNKTVFHPQCIVFFEENHVKIAKLNNNQLFFVMPNIDAFNKFQEQFIIPKSFIFVEKVYSKGELFAYLDNLCERNEKLLGGITAIENGFLGDGIYCVSEEDYLEDAESVNLLKEYNFDRNGFKTNKDVTLIFEHVGYYYKTIWSEKYTGICKLFSFHVSLEEIKAITESYYEVVEA